MNSFDRTPDKTLLDRFPAHEKTALQTAREGIILLRNQDAILPLAKKRGTILLTGEFLDNILHGGGAATVNGYNLVTLAEALQAVYGDQLVVNAGATDAEIAAADSVILSVATQDSEGWDRPYDLDVKYEADILRVAGLNKRVIAVIQSGSGINLSRWHNKVAAILYAWYGGQCGATGVAELISGSVNPSGKLPITLERDFRESPGYGYLPKGEQLYSGWSDELEKVHPVFDVVYEEDIFIGYRWYDSKQIAPLYPFGFGMSYTQFEYSDLQVKVGETVELSFSIRNSGQVDGAEIAQVYIQDLVSSIPRPLKELKGFERKLIKKGESTRISLALSRRDFMFWSPTARDWVLEPGAFRILIGASSADICLEVEITL